jgi:hypothetical protein
MKKLIYIITSLCLFGTFPLIAQNSFGVFAGIGILDLTHIGVDYFPTKQTHLRVSGGIIPLKSLPSKFYFESISLEGLYHFGWQPSIGETKNLYFKSGFSRIKQGGKNRLHTYKFLTTCLGSDIHFTEHWGMSLGLGFQFLLDEKVDSYVYSQEWEESYQGMFPIFPKIDLECYYRF